MVENRKSTAWRKNRKLGDVQGGRMRPKLEDNIFHRCHNLKAPTIGQETPVIIEENPSRDFFFPLKAEEALEILKTLPQEHIEGITHLWFRKIKKTDYLFEKVNFAEYICGRGVRVIILYPWPKTLALSFANKKPSAKLLKEYSTWTTDLRLENQEWKLYWTADSLKRFYAESLLLHEIGHHLENKFRPLSKTSTKQAEEFANQYAIQWSQFSKQIFVL
ncbi:MAG: hypothetical protein HY819_17295 [Acidobacteria bacterium]|nr:hypothetical protein [Acidobacteriota bacterium]